MHFALSARYGPHLDGVQHASASLQEFLCMFHANWDREARTAAAHLDNGEAQTFSELFAGTSFEPIRQQLWELQCYGAVDVQPFFERPGAEQLSRLRDELPFRYSFAHSSQDLVFDLDAWQHHTAKVASLNVLYLLLLRTNFWQSHLKRVLDLDKEPTLYSLGLTCPRRQPLSRRDPHDCERFVTEVFLLREEMRRRSQPNSIHPLEVLARLYDPQFFADQLSVDLVELPLSGT